MTEHDAGKHFTWMPCIKFSRRNGMLQVGPCDSLLCWIEFRKQLQMMMGLSFYQGRKKTSAKSRKSMNESRETDDFCKTLLLGNRN